MMKDELMLLFSSFSNKSSYDLLRVGVANLFSNTQRYSYSGRSAPNARHATTTKAAADLNLVSLLLGNVKHFIIIVFEF